jgi:hypothetical protein
MTPPSANWVLRVLRNTDRSMVGYVWRAWLIALLPSLAISAVVTLVLPDHEPPLKGPAAFLVVGALLVSPWLETLMMWPVLWVLKQFSGSTVGVAAASAVLWGILHSLAAPTWGLVVAWPFFVFSVCFLEWEKNTTTGRAIVATALVHMCQNSLPVLALIATNSGHVPAR